MPYDEQLAARLRTAVPERAGVKETRLFDSLGYLINGKLCCGAHRDCFLFRLGPLGLRRWSELVAGLRPMDDTGKVMKGWAMIEGRRCSEGELESLAREAMEYARSLSERA